MIDAIVEHPGFLRICDSSHENHIVAVSVIKSVAKAGPKTSYVTYRGGTKSIFINAPVEVVQTEVKRAKILKRARQATEKRQWCQLQLDFEKETAAQLPTETAATDAHREDEARNE